MSDRKDVPAYPRSRSKQAAPPPKSDLLVLMMEQLIADLRSRRRRPSDGPVLPSRQALRSLPVVDLAAWRRTLA